MNLFLNRYKKLGHEINPGDIKRRRSIRINTNKVDVDKILMRLRENCVVLEKIPFLKTGYYVEAEFSPGSTPEYLMGYYYIQEAASQAASVVLDPQPGDHVLDMCAAPGSKTTHLSEIMQNKGVIIALDNNLMRIEPLRNNLERMGCKNVLVYKKDAKFADDLEIKFDKILLDAPCSGNFVTDPNWFAKRDIEGVKDNSREQKKLIATALSILKKGGVLVYSTCSLEPEENEEVIEYALSEFEIELEDTALSVGEPGITEKTKNCRRFWPDKTHTQGFFIAKMRRK